MRPDEPCVHERDATGPLARFFYNTGLPCAQCEREAHEAWEASVRDRLHSALYAIGHGWGWQWEAPGVYGRPDLPPGAVVKQYADGTYTITLDGGLS